MKRNEALWGGLLIGAGVLLLVQNFGWLGAAEDIVWTLLFAAAGATFIGRYLTHRTVWGPLIPGTIFLGVAAIMALQMVAPVAGAQWGGPIFLAAISVGFWLVYGTNLRQWWAIIPAGILTSLSAVAAIDLAAPGTTLGGGALLLGIAATFVLVYVLPSPNSVRRWALIPAAVCGAVGTLVLTHSVAALDYLWPATLIAGGIYLLYRRVWTRPTSGEPDDRSRPAITAEQHYDEPTIPEPH